MRGAPTGAAAAQPVGEAPAVSGRPAGTARPRSRPPTTPRTPLPATSGPSMHPGSVSEMGRMTNQEALPYRRRSISILLSGVYTQPRIMVSLSPSDGKRADSASQNSARSQMVRISRTLSGSPLIAA
jgi:hypothetical protein